MRFVSALLLALVAPSALSDQVAAANGVMHRLIGRRADAFHFTLIPKRGNLDVFTISAVQGRVSIAGSSGTALTRGAYTYLKETCHCLVTWDGDQLDLPATLPNYSGPEVVCPNRFRLYYNVCTFGYTMPFWDWRKWEHEIDWMALHGINMPLAMTGQERVWEDVWMKYGITDLQALNFFGGPAFLPWHWMGNQDGHGGPMPQDYVDRSVDLQKRILARERELGMTPVVPGFSGFVPKAFQDIYRRARVLTASGWVGFPPTHQLDPRDPMFPIVQRRFIQAYTKLYGSDHLYLCDLYNEMKPTVSQDRQLQDLAETGAAISDSITKADPHGIWVMQGWLFHNDPRFWKEPEMAAFLGGIPADRMILLDLAGDQAEIWRQSAAFRQKPYIWNLLHGFGGATPLFGDLALVAKRPIKALTDPNHGVLVGMGLTMEGTNENSVEYELMCDSMWRDAPLDPITWMQSYLEGRYGEQSAEIRRLADGIREQFYTGNEDGAGSPHYQQRPGVNVVTKPSANVEGFRALVETMLALPPAVRAKPLFRRDLVDVTKRFAAEAIDAKILACVAAARARDAVAIAGAKKAFDAAMLDIDALLDTIPRYRLSAWISDARHSSADSDLMERNARMQVTVWGGQDLYDYAAKEWSGLVGDFYRNRWDRFFDALSAPGFNEASFRRDIAKWELDWCSQTTLPRIPRVDAVAQARKLLDELR